MDTHISEQIEGIGQQIKWLRRQAGLTQVELAAMAGVSHQLIGKLEVGGPVTLTSLLTIASHLDVSCCLCHYRSGPPTLSAVPEFRDNEE